MANITERQSETDLHGSKGIKNSKESVGKADPESIGYRNGWEHYDDELMRIDELIRIEISKLTARPAGSAYGDPFRGLVITDEEIEALLQEDESSIYDTDQNVGDSLALGQIERRIAAKLEMNARSRVFLPFPHVCEVFRLSAMESQIVLFCLAAELNRKYEKLYGYLHDDVTAKWPTPALIARLTGVSASSDGMAAMRKALLPTSTLSRYLLRKPADADTRSLLSRPLQLDERIVRFLLDGDTADDGLERYARVILPSEPPPELLVDSEVQEKLQAFMDGYYANRYESTAKRAVFNIHGPSGCGKTLQTRYFCRRYGHPLLLVDTLRLAHAADGEQPLRERFDRLYREAILLQAVVCFQQTHRLADDEPASKIAPELVQSLLRWNGIAFLLGDEPWKPAELTNGTVYTGIELRVPETNDRQRIWTTLSQSYAIAPEVEWPMLASKFRLTAGQIERALLAAQDREAWRSGSGAHGPVTIGEHALTQACYAQIQHQLDKKAVRLTPRYRWDDLILPPEQIGQLRNACSQIKYRHLVFGEWGFDRKLSYGKGLSMLFSGPPGTGKTMSAEVVATELNLEIYRIDLSQIVSKYIGETEKNLQELFGEAQRSHAILLFDEADALFGKRSEVRSSNDKFANAEAAFLLQKMEEYEGISVLATNYLQNIDEAFMRRLNYVIKYPFPDATYREQIWRSMFPQEAPLDEDIDFRFVGQTFQIAGGNIKNAAVTAAFLAAESGEPIGMKHLLKGALMEIGKTGAMLPREQLGIYGDLLT